MGRSANSPLHAACAAVLLAAICALTLVFIVGDATGEKSTVIGKTKKAPGPSCPTPEGKPPFYKECQAVGEVTGLQKRADGEVNPFKIPESGHIVAWSIDLSKPNKDERAFFTDAPSGHPDLDTGVGWGKPSARISILKKLKHRRFKLVKQSRKVKLSSQLGEQPIFTMKEPLRVKKGRFVAITTPNWISALAHDRPEMNKDSDVWIASRGPKHCDGQDSVEHSRAQQKKGGIRKYGCKYYPARLLYWAYLIPDES